MVSVKKLFILIAGIMLLCCCPVVVFAATNPIGYTLVPSSGLPSTTKIGSSYSFVYTLVNNLPFSKKIDNITQDVNGTGFSITDPCNGQTLTGNGGSCQIHVRFHPQKSGSESLELTLRYDNNVVPLPTLSTTVQPNATEDMSGAVTKALPADTAVGTGYPVEFTFTNVGNANVTPSGIQLTGNTADFTNQTNGCTSVLTPGSDCTVSGTFTPSASGERSIGATYEYEGGSKKVPVTTHTIASSSGSCASVSGDTDLLLPTDTYIYADNVVEFKFTNHCDNASATLGSITLSATLGSTADASVTSWLTKGDDTCSGSTLAANQSCTVYASVIPKDIGNHLAINAKVNYTESSQTKLASVTTTSDSVLANSTTNRMITVINQCPFPVWMSFVAAAVPNSPTCTKNSQCPTGSVCNTSAGLCYYSNPSLDGNHPNGKLNAALANKAPDTMNISISQDNSGTSPRGNILYNAGIAARLDCTGSGSSLSCAINNCGGTANPATGSTGSDGMCSPGVGVSSTPGMSFNAVEFTFLRNYIAANKTEDGVYDEQTINGVNVPMEIKGRGPESSGAAPYANCQAAGAVIQKTTGSASTQLGSCNYQYSPPSNGTNDPANYRYVTPVGNVACNKNNPCTSPNVCGLAYGKYDPGQPNTDVLALRCGRLQGYVSVNTGICSQGANAFAPGVDLYTTYKCGTNFTYSTGAQLYACSGTYAGQSCYNPAPGNPSNSCCGCVNWWQKGITVPTSTESCTNNGTLYSNPDWTDPNGIVQSQIQWVKEACPTAYAYQYDDPSSSFQCTVLNSAQSQIVTNYQVTFCPGGKTISGSGG